MARCPYQGHDCDMKLTRNDLTPSEHALLDSLESGHVFSPRTTDCTLPTTVRASVIRDIMRHAYPDVTPDPKGLRMTGVRIEGRVDLDHIICNIPLEIADSELTEGLTAHNAELKSLILTEMAVERPSKTEPILHLEDLKVGQLVLNNIQLINDEFCALYANSISITGTADFAALTATGRGAQGAVSLSGATIGGQLVLIGAKLTNLKGPALVADGITIGLDALLYDGFSAKGSGTLGTVRLPKAVISGAIFLSGANLKNSDGPALVADGIMAKSDVFMSDGFTCVGSGELGAARLLGAMINGQLVLRGAHLKNHNGPALNADNLTTGTDVYMDDFIAEGNGELGTLRIPGATVEGHLSFQRSRLTNPNGPALWAHYSVIKAYLHLNQGFTAEGNTDTGTIYLLGASINGQLLLQGATLNNSIGPAFFGDYLSVGSSARFDGLTAEGEGKEGTVRLPRARIQGELSFSGANLANKSGCAFSADDLIVHSNVRLDGGFSATGYGKSGAARLPAAIIKGQLVLNNACLINPSGPLLRAENLVVEFRTVVHLLNVFSVQKPLTDPLKVTGENYSQTELDASIILRGASLGEFHVSESTLEFAHFSGFWDITGMSYTALESTSGMGYRGSGGSIRKKWLVFLRNGTVDFAPQPYQQFSKITHAEGDEQFTREIRIAQRDDLRARGGLSAWQRRGLGLIKHTVGYGYQSWRAILWLVGVLAIVTFVNMLFGGVIPAPITIGPLGLAQQSTAMLPNTENPCRTVDLIKLSIDTIPLISRNAGNVCGPTDTWSGAVYVFLSVFFNITAWALVTLFVAGYTKLVRDPS